MGTAKVRAIPEISCNHVDAGLIHEAAIGRIAGEQLLKLETLGLTPEEAEEKNPRGLPPLTIHRRKAILEAFRYRFFMEYT